MNVPQLHPPTVGHLGYFQFLIITSKPAINIHMQIFVYILAFISFGKTPRNVTAVPYDKIVFKFVRNFQTVFQSGCNLNKHLML